MSVPGIRGRLEGAVGAGMDALADRMGGAARRRAVFLLACVLALDSADKGAIGAVAAELERSLHIGNADIGLLVTVSSLVGALATVPMGVLTDRTRRTRLLWVTILAWGVAQAVSGLSVSFLTLLLTRVALGGATAAAGPAVASLVGDLFPAAERGRMYGFILTGELVGAGVGVLVAGEVTGLLGWRASFFILSLPSLALAAAIHRLLPEPARSGEVERAPTNPAPPEREIVPAGDDPALPDQALPDQALPDPASMRLWTAVRYVLRVRTNVVLIVSSSLGYFFFAGVQTFALIFIRSRYSLGQSAGTGILVLIGTGAVAGVLVGGRVADMLLRRGRIDARLTVGAVGYGAAAVLFVPALLVPQLAAAVPIYIVASAALAAPNPPLNAARLDVISSRLWGRAEGVRNVVQTVLQAASPLLFGLVSQLLGGSHVGLGTGIDQHHAVSAAQGRGLEYTFLIMVAPLAAGGVLLMRGRRHFPADVASARALRPTPAPPTARTAG